MDFKLGFVTFFRQNKILDDVYTHFGIYYGYVVSFLNLDLRLSLPENKLKFLELQYHHRYSILHHFVENIFYFEE